MKKLEMFLGLGLMLLTLGPIEAAEFTLKISEKEPPKGVGEPIRKVLQPRAIQVLDGDKPLYEFWFRSPLPLKTKPASTDKALDALAEVTLLGVVWVGEGRRDYKDNEIAPGAYTIRFGLQPQDGDHLGTAEFTYFAVLIAAKNDPDLDGIKTYKAMVKASGKGAATSHPIVLSLRPTSSETGETPTIIQPAPDHEAIKIKLPAKAPNAEQALSIAFELVFSGKYKT